MWNISPGTLDEKLDGNLMAEQYELSALNHFALARADSSAHPICFVSLETRPG